MRLIDADALIKNVEQQIDFLYSFEMDELVECGRIIHNGIIQEVKMMPTIDAEPIRHGHWIKMSDADGHYYACSECGEELHREWSFDRKFVICFPKKITIDKTQFCSHCGAKMDEVEE